MASSSGQAGGSLIVENDGVDILDIYAPVDSIADCDKHYYIPVHPTQTQDIKGYNGTGTAYKFVMPGCICYPLDTFYTANGTIYTGASGTTTIAAYNPATVTTHCTIQNNAMSLFSQAEIKHNAKPAETIQKPGMCQVVDWVMTPKDIAEHQSPNDFTWLKRADTFEGAGGVKLTTTNLANISGLVVGADDSGGAGFTTVTLKAPNASKATTAANIGLLAATAENKATYDESFENRCMITGKPEFQISGKLPFTLCKYRPQCVALNKTEIILMREEDGEILENRSGVAARLMLTNLTMWLHCVNPSNEKMSNIMAGIANGSEQKIAGKRFVYEYKDIAKDTSAFPVSNSLTTRPSKVFVGFRTETQVSKRTWNHQDVKSVSCKFNGQLVNDASLEVNDWTSKKDARALYEHYVQATGQSGFGGIPCLTFEEFIDNYCLWAFDTAASPTNMLALAKKDGQLDLEVKFQSGKAAVKLIMDIFIVYDSMYSIKGPQDTLTPYY